MSRSRTLLSVIGPGLLLAATGVGAGDLATASFAGSLIGPAILWAVVVGALMKWVLNEGLARWQLATGTTLLEGAVTHLGRWALWLFVPYFLLWSFFVGAAMMSACGVTLQAMLPPFLDPAGSKLVLGAGASALGVALVLRGGFRLIERVMSACIGLMFVTVLLTAALAWPEVEGAWGGLIPSLPGTEEGTTWTMALMGGVGGTVTVLCYGYWIREEGRFGPEDLGICRIDLGVGYAVTAVFGLCMVIVGSTLHLDGRGASLLVVLGDRLGASLGAAGRWVFLVGALGAVFSSLLGVWQAVPYLFADLWRLLLRSGEGAVHTDSPVYRAYLLAIAIIPALGLVVSFREVQKVYAIAGAAFMPLLALVLLVLGGRRAWAGAHRNRWPSAAALVAVLTFFGWMAWETWAGT